MIERLKKVGGFLLIPVLLWCWAYYDFDQKRNTLYPQLSAADKAIREAPDSFHLLVAGHSRMNRGIDTVIFKNAVKVGTPGESYIETYYKLKFIFEEQKKYPQIVLLPFEEGTFKPNDFRRSFYWKDYVSFKEVGQQKGMRAFYFKEYVFACIFPFRQYYSKSIQSGIEHKFALTNKETELDKTQMSYERYSEEQRQGMIQDDIRFLEKEGLMDKSSLYYVRKTIALCQKHRVKLFYIKCPLTGDYTKALDQLSEEQNYNEQSLIDLINDSDEVTYINMKNIFEHQNDLFFDHHHLNEKGSKVFTERLVTEIIKHSQ